MESIKIENLEKNELVSDILEQAIKCMNGENNLADLKTIKLEQVKDIELVESFLISVAAGTFIEAIKYVIARIKNRKNYNEDALIKIDDKIYKLKEIEEIED